MVDGVNNLSNLSFENIEAFKPSIDSSYGLNNADDFVLRNLSGLGLSQMIDETVRLVKNQPPSKLTDNRIREFRSTVLNSNISPQEVLSSLTNIMKQHSLETMNLPYIGERINFLA